MTYDGRCMCCCSGLLSKMNRENCSLRGQILEQVTPTEKGGKPLNGRLASLESAFKYHGCHNYRKHIDRVKK